FFDRYLKGLILAPGQKEYYTVPSTYLVISAPAYVNDEELLSYVADKRRRGFHVVVVSTDETGTTSAQIRSYIKDALNTWDYPPTFVLLVGDTNTIPAWTGCGAGTPDTDLYYAALDGDEDYCDDYFADLFIGRFSVRSTEELHNIVNKSVSFEWLSEVNYERIKKATFLASEDNWEISEGTHDYVIDTYLDPMGYTVFKRYRHTYNATTAEVISDINGGLSMVTYSGHGGSTEWVDGPPLDQDDVRSLTNVYYPWVQSYACSTGDYDYMDECFAETWIRDDHGAVAFWGSSVSSYCDEDDILERRLYDGFLGGDSGVYYTWIGGMIDYGKLKLYEYYGDTATIQRYFEMYNLMGDASIDVWTDDPAAVEPSYPPFIEMGATSYTVTFTEPQAESAVVSLVKDDELVGAARVSGGVATIVFEEPISEVGEYLLSVVGHNIAPFEATVEVTVSPDGSVSMDRDVYGGNDTINIYLTDSDLAGEGTHDVEIKSDSHTTPISVTLSEQGTSGVFRGSIGTTPAGGRAKDALPVSDGDTITVTYIDADDGEGGHDVPKTDTATADLAPPNFDGLQSAEAGDGQVSLAWQPGTDISEPITYLVFRSTEPGEYDFESPLVETMDTGYVDTDVTNYVTYYYIVRARDSLGNVDDNMVEKPAQPTGSVRFYYEDFETRSVSDWTVVDGNSDGATWTTDNPLERSSQWWTGTFFIADSGTASGEMDEELISPQIDASFFTDIELRFGYGHVKNTLSSRGEAYIKCGDGAWSREFRTTETDGGIASVDLPPNMDGCEALQIKFYYSQWGTMNDSWFGVDNIELWGEP
ncbi:MAG TPA: hypothetical protein ENF73_06670, partial [Proteobacteria bacterium]|nr:hypothetical protein [Pseudomonadota bacterium]